MDLGSAWLWLTPMREPVHPSQHKPQSLQLPLSGSRTTQGTSIHRERVRSDVHGHFRSLQSTAHNPQARTELSSASRSKSLVLRNLESDEHEEEEEESLVQPVQSSGHQAIRREGEKEMFVSQESLSYDHSQRPFAFYSHQAGTVRTVCCVFFSRVFPSHRKFTRGFMGSRPTP